MKPRVLLRAASGEGIGIGHAMRTRAVAEALVQAGAEPLLVVDDPLTARAVELAGVEVATAVERPDWCAEPAAGAWLDGFRDWSRELARLEARGVPARLVESRGPERGRCREVVYPSLHWAPDAWDRDHADRVLAGPGWIPLSRAVRETPRPPARDVELLITFGGSDPLRLTERTLDALDLADRRTVVAIGPHMAPRRAEIVALARQGRDVTVLPTGVPLARWMARARVALTALGTTLYELAYLGTGALVLANHAADREPLAWYAGHGPHLPIGIAAELSQEGLRAALAAGIRTLEQRAPVRVPGLGTGAERLAERLLGRAA